MEPCIFCGIANKKSPGELEYEDAAIVAFNDINPKAKVHLLIVPKKHISSVTQLQESDVELVGRMIMVAKKLAEDKGIAEDGYRLVFNAGKHGGQVVEHIHLHLMGGGPLNDMI